MGDYLKYRFVRRVVVVGFGVYVRFEIDVWDFLGLGIVVERIGD